ncbi:MAG TPA: ABC transporter permease [Anaerolineaceae bacterium]
MSELASDLPTKSESGLIRFLRQVIPYVIAVIAALAAVGIIIGAMGYDVFRAYTTILFTSFRTPNGFIQTVIKFVPLMLEALAFTVPLAAGKFNIGGEGQLLMGGIGAAAAGILFKDLPPILLIPIVLLAGVLFGAFWGLIPGWLLYRFELNEILSTVLLNSVALLLVDYVATQVWPDTSAGHPMTVPIGDHAFLPMLIQNPPLSSGIILAIMVAVGIYIYTNRTAAGYELIATGSNPRASRVFGINIRRMFVLSLVIAGGLAGLAGAIEVAGERHNLIEGMQSNYLLLGLIIGLIAQGNNLAVPFVAFMIAILEVGASAMQRTIGLPGEMSMIIEALILVFVLLSNVVRRRR